MTPDGHRDTKTVELPAEQMDVVYELLVRGFGQTPAHDREYGDAFDAFTEEAGYPLRIGDQPERVQEAIKELVRRNNDPRR